MDIRTKRVYEEPAVADGYRVLVDRLWPRGVSKDDAALDEWKQELAPSDELRTWFDHDPERWSEFRRRYREELAEHEAAVDELLSLAREGRVTLVYAASDETHNNATALQTYLRERASDEE